MKDIFSDFVRSLDPTGEPTLSALDELWTELRGLLAQELRRRGLGESSPRCLGIVGHPRWTTPDTARASGAPIRTRDALDELASDAYAEIFGRRLPNLQRYVAAGQDIGGVVRQCIRQFLHDRQKRSDRLGFRVYQRLRVAVEEMVQAGRLTILEGGTKIDNRSTLLASRTDSGAAPASAERLSGEVRRWNDEILLDWVSSEEGSREHLIERLQSLLSDLAPAGIEIFSFKTLIDVLKHDIRSRLAVLWEGPSRNQASSKEDPLHRAVEESRLRELSGCVETRLERLSLHRRTRHQLAKLWRFLVDFSATAADPEVAASQGEPIAGVLLADTLPSNRELSRLLGFRADRFPTLMARLRSEVERCVEELREAPLPATVGATPGGSVGFSGAEAAMDESRDLRRELQRRTAEAYRDGAGNGARSDAPHPGDLYVLPACPEPGIEWALLSIGTPAGQVLLVPADTLAWVGSSDLAVVDEAVTGPLTLRCGHGLWLDEEALIGQQPSGALVQHEVERALEVRRRWLSGELETTAPQREIDIDPDYRDWYRTLEATRRAVCRALQGRSDERSADATPPAEVHPMVKERERRRPGQASKSTTQPSAKRFLALAAMVTLGLTGGWWFARSFNESDLRERINELEASLEADHRRFREELDAEKARAEAEKRRLVQRHSEEMASLEKDAQDQLAQLTRPRLMPWLSVPRGIQRGSPVSLVVPSEARFFGLLLAAEAGDRLDIQDAGGKVIVSEPIPIAGTSDSEVLLRLPASHMPPGEYVVRVLRDAQVHTRIRLRIENP